MTPPAAIVRGMPAALYRAHAGLNVSKAKRLLRSPLHFAKTPEKEPTPAMILGTVTHDHILEGRTNFVVRPEGMDYRSSAGKAWRDAQILPILTSDEAIAAVEMSAAVAMHPACSAALAFCRERELSIFATYRGVLIKARLDAACLDPTVCATDLKTTTDSSPAAWGKTVANFDYLLQAAWYRTALALATGCEYGPAWAWITVESEPPYAAAFYRPTEDQLALGQRQMDRVIDLYLKCDETGRWPGYSDGEQVLELPAWAYRNEEVTA